MNIRIIWLALAAVALPFAAQAENTNGWDGQIALGYLASEGNTDSTSATGEFKATYTKNKWTHGANGRFFSASDEQGTTAENYLLGWKSTYSFTEKNYLFGKADWIKNRFSGFPRQVFATAGYGRRLISNDTIEFDAELGAGYADQKAVTELPPPAPETIDEDGAVATGALDFKWTWTETSDFSQYLGANYTENNTFWESITKVSAKINSALALGISYTVQGNTDVAPGIEKIDRYTAITLDYNF
jgi:putative salt-induced outer membrane protein